MFSCQGIVRVPARELKRFMAMVLKSISRWKLVHDNVLIVKKTLQLLFVYVL